MNCASSLFTGILILLIFSSCGVIQQLNVASSCLAEYTTQNNSLSSDVSISSASTQLAQSFSLSESRSINSVRLVLKSAGANAETEFPLTGSWIVKIETDDSGKPSGDTLLSKSTDATTLSSLSFQNVDVTFSSSATLAAGTYWIRLQYTSASSSKRLIWQSDQNGTYSGSAVSSTDGTTWENGLIGASRDFFFQLGCQ